MENIAKLNDKLKKLNNNYKISEMLHELSLLSIPEDKALKVYELAKELNNINY